jgi:hypothetical protein
LEIVKINENKKNASNSDLMRRSIIIDRSKNRESIKKKNVSFVGDISDEKE